MRRNHYEQKTFETILHCFGSSMKNLPVSHPFEIQSVLPEPMNSELREMMEVLWKAHIPTGQILIGAGNQAMLSDVIFASLRRPVMGSKRAIRRQRRELAKAVNVRTELITGRRRERDDFIVGDGVKPAQYTLAPHTVFLSLLLHPEPMDEHGLKTVKSVIAYYGLPRATSLALSGWTLPALVEAKESDMDFSLIDAVRGLEDQSGRDYGSAYRVTRLTQGANGSIVIV